MKEKVENLIKQVRDNHLISIGLIDEQKTNRIYSSYGYQTSEFSLWDPERKEYYKDSFGALDVTNEEYLEICKYFPPTILTEKKESTQLISDVKSIKKWVTFFGILLIIQIVCALIWAITVIL